MVVGRRHHTTAVIHLDNAHKRLIHFGGLPATRREGDALAATSIVEISEYGCEVLCAGNKSLYTIYQYYTMHLSRTGFPCMHAHAQQG